MFILVDKHILNARKPNKKKYWWFLTNPSENLTNIILVVSQPSIHPPAQASSPATNLWPRFPGEAPGRSRNSSRSPPPRSNARDGKMCHLRISIWWCTIKKIWMYTYDNVNIYIYTVLHILHYLYVHKYIYMCICEQKDPCSGYDLYWLTVKGL